MLIGRNYVLRIKVFEEKSLNTCLQDANIEVQDLNVFTFSNDYREDAEPASGPTFIVVCRAGQKKIWLFVSHQALVLLGGDQFVDKDITV